MGVLEQYKQLEVRAIQQLAVYNQKKEQLANLNTRRDEYSNKLEQLKDSQQTLEDAYAAMKQLIDLSSSSAMKEISQLLSFAVKTIFFDHEYSIEFLLDDKRAVRTLELLLVELLPSGQTIKTPMDAIGGGILCVIGFVLQLYYLLQTGSYPILFADEAFSQLSDLYVEPLVEFIRILSEKQGLRLVLISHDPRLIPYADKLYQVTQGKVEVKA